MYREEENPTLLEDVTGHWIVRPFEVGISTIFAMNSLDLRELIHDCVIYRNCKAQCSDIVRASSVEKYMTYLPDKVFH